MMRSSWSCGLGHRSWSRGLGQWEEEGGCASAGASADHYGRSWSCVCATSMCALVSSFSLQVFLPLLKKAAQGSPGSALSCSRAAIINMSSSGGSIVEVTLFDMAQLISYRCSKVCPVVNMGPDFCSQQTTVKPSVSPPSIPAPLHLVTEVL